MLVQIIHMYRCMYIYTNGICRYISTHTRVVRGGGNWQHSNPISHACNHHDHYERKCRKSRRFLTATERPPTTDRPTERPTLFFVSGNLASCSNRIRTVHSLGGGIATMGIKRRTKLCGMQKVVTPPTPQQQLKAGGSSSGILCRQQQQQMTLIAFLGALFASQSLPKPQSQSPSPPPSSSPSQSQLARTDNAAALQHLLKFAARRQDALCSLLLFCATILI